MFSKKRKKSYSKKFSGDLQTMKTKKVFAKFSARFLLFSNKILTVKKVVLSSSRGKGNFGGLETSIPRTSSRTPPLLVAFQLGRRFCPSSLATPMTRWVHKSFVMGNSIRLLLAILLLNLQLSHLSLKPFSLKYFCRVFKRKNSIEEVKKWL